MRSDSDKKLFDNRVNNPGRPPKEIDLEQLEKLAEIHCTEKEMCVVLGISQDTMTRRKEDPEFAMILERGRAKGKISLRRAHFQMAMSNPAVHIFSCKNYLGMVDKPDDGGPIPQDQARRIKQALDAIDSAVIQDPETDNEDS